MLLNSFVSYNFYICRGKASNIDMDGDSSIGDSINNDDVIGDVCDNDQLKSEASGI